MPRLHFCFVGSRPAMTVLAWIAVLPFDLRCAPPVLPITIGRPGSSPPRSLPKRDFNAIPQQTATAEIPIASSDAHPRHTSRGFLPCRFAYAGPRVRRATVVGPPSANLHKSGHVILLALVKTVDKPRQICLGSRPDLFQTLADLRSFRTGPCFSGREARARQPVLCDPRPQRLV
jgi:hypothetical protein